LEIIFYYKEIYSFIIHGIGEIANGLMKKIVFLSILFEERAHQLQIEKS